MVIMYQPSCPHCQRLERELNRVMDRIKVVTQIDVPVGILVCDSRDMKLLEFCEKMNFEAFPHLELFWRGDSIVYKGLYKPDDIANWINKVLETKHKIITGKIDLEDEMNALKKSKGKLFELIQ